MTEEKPLDPETWFHTKRARACVEALNRVGFTGIYAANREDALKAVLEAIPQGASVGIGGSVTVRALGIHEALKARGNKVFDHWDSSLSPEERTRARDGQITADVFLSSTNALTMKGTLINIDGTGNRVAAMIFGPKTSIVACGYNKIVADVEEGLARVRDYAAPVNYKRLGREMDEADDEIARARAYAITTVLEAKPGGKEKFVVVVVGEKLGY
ncbi:MAG: lactate utilization protein [Bacillota bacterium]|jgi:L-lactate utilization protein LutB|nr:LUD domain-containing protein [Candidatus Fermentithermobacillaceae bacterium]